MTPQRKPTAIILAAGYSRRMGEFKPLMKLGAQTVLERAVSLYRAAGVADIRVVTGFRSETIRSALSSQPAGVIHNPAYDSGMFSSVQAAVNALPANVRSFFVHPVDIPLVRPHTLTMLMDAFDRCPSPVVYPVFDGLRGHPPLVHGKLKDPILSHDGRGGLRDLLIRFDSGALEVQVADEGVLLDLDAPDDFQRLSRRLIASTRLTEDECRVLMEKVQRLPGPVIDHCRQVACVAESLARAICGSGGAIDVPLVRSAALVHDVARLKKNHAAAGADLLNAMGFPAMAAIVAVHMHIDVATDALLDPAQIVHLADKLVDGSKLVSLPQRFNAKLKKFAHDPTVSEKINRRRCAALTIQDNVERVCGSTIQRMLTEAGMVRGDQA